MNFDDAAVVALLERKKRRRDVDVEDRIVLMEPHVQRIIEMDLGEIEIHHLKFLNDFWNQSWMLEKYHDFYYLITMIFKEKNFTPFFPEKQ